MIFQQTILWNSPGDTIVKNDKYFIHYIHGYNQWFLAMTHVRMAAEFLFLCCSFANGCWEMGLMTNSVPDGILFSSWTSKKCCKNEYLLVYNVRKSQPSVYKSSSLTIGCFAGH